MKTIEFLADSGAFKKGDVIAVDMGTAEYYIERKIAKAVKEGKPVVEENKMIKPEKK